MARVRQVVVAAAVAVETIAVVAKGQRRVTELDRPDLDHGKIASEIVHQRRQRGRRRKKKTTTTKKKRTTVRTELMKREPVKTIDRSDS